MGQNIQGAPADAGRVPPGYRFCSSPTGTLRALLILPSRCSAAASAPVALRTPLALRTSPLRGHVLRAPAGLAKGLYGLATPAASRGGGACPLVRLAAHGGPRRGAGNTFPRSIAFRFALQSRPSLLSRSTAAGLDRARCALQGATPAGSGCAISSPLRGSGNARRRIPRCHAPLLQPETPLSPCGTLPARRFMRRLRRAETIKRR